MQPPSAKLTCILSPLECFLSCDITSGDCNILFGGRACGRQPGDWRICDWENIKEPGLCISGVIQAEGRGTSWRREGRKSQDPSGTSLTGFVCSPFCGSTGESVSTVSSRGSTHSKCTTFIRHFVKCLHLHLAAP